MFGIVIVSHSRTLAKSLCELAVELSGKNIPVSYAGGVEGKDEAFGTDATDIMAAVESVYSDDGVIIFADMGSALISSETALDFIDPDKAENIYISSAPLVEGVINAALQCSIGTPLKLSLSEAEESLFQKIEYLKKDEANFKSGEISRENPDLAGKENTDNAYGDTDSSKIISNDKGLNNERTDKTVISDKKNNDKSCNKDISGKIIHNENKSFEEDRDSSINTLYQSELTESIGIERGREADIENKNITESEFIYESATDKKLNKIFIIKNRNGLHARPAAKLIKAVSESGCSAQISNITKNRGPVNALSMNRLSTLELVSGDEMLVEPEGDSEGCAGLLEIIKKLVDDNFGEEEAAVYQKKSSGGKNTGSKDKYGKSDRIRKDSLELSESIKSEDWRGQDVGLKNNEADPCKTMMYGQKDIVVLSAGIALGEVFIIDSSEIDTEIKKCESIDDEIKKLERAVEKVKSEIRKTVEQVENRLPGDKMQILETHLFILDDPDLKEEAALIIRNEKYTAASAWSLSAKAVIDRYEKLENEYLKIRSTDVKDAASRVLKYLVPDQEKGNSKLQDSFIPQGAVIAAEKLTPSQVLRFDPEKIGGIILAENNTTSHATILAKSLGIPAIGGYEKVRQLKMGSLIGLDALNCRVYTDPDKKVCSDLTDEKELFISERKRLQEESAALSYTKDGKRIKIYANIASVSEAEAAVKNGAEGVGVLRTEFLFLDKNAPPSEDEQISFFSEIFRIMEGRPVTVRTLDIGGDKIIPYMDLPGEDNPFLGLRGVRIYDKYRNLFKTHVRSILRAGFENDLKIMIPMISQYYECRKVYEIIKDVHKELEKENADHIWPVEIGIMIETPSSVIMAKELAGVSDFFSIGTNDLTQYVLAAERGNPSLSYYSDPYDPSVLRSVRTAVLAAETAGIEVSLCGELGGDPLAAPLLIGMGISCLSMNPFKIPAVKKAVRNIKSAECSEKCVSVLFKAVSADDVKEIMEI